MTALSTAEANYLKAAAPKERIVLQAAIKFNGGGRINHMFWVNLTLPTAHNKGGGGVLHAGPLKKAIEKTWGTFEDLKEFNTIAAAIQDSGRCWLGYNAKNKTLKTDEDPLLTHVLIVGVDTWYLVAIWNVTNMEEARRRLLD